MTARTGQNTPRADGGFRHQALLYAGDDEFIGATVPFIRDAVAADEPILVVVSSAKIDRLRAHLGEAAAHVDFEDMVGIGTNPARIIPAWLDFVDRHGASGRRLRGIGEPVWPGRSDAELVECERHECLLNLAFEDAADFWLLCPYDTAALGAAAIERAHHSHPVVVRDRTERASRSFMDRAEMAAPLAEPLPAAPARAAELAFDEDSLFALRGMVAARAATAGLDDARAGDLVLAVHEMATNSVRHGGGHGVLRMWAEDAAVISEVRDGGRIVHPLAGRRRPNRDQLGGHGLWLINQLCDLVQIRALPHGGVVRVHMRR
jgi:anti-sigma regulatory factor (Ser/Thr protein kinase)